MAGTVLCNLIFAYHYIPSPCLLEKRDMLLSSVYLLTCVSLAFLVLLLSPSGIPGKTLFLLQISALLLPLLRPLGFPLAG